MKRTLSAFAASGLIQVLGFFTGVVTARVLGPEARGELASIMSVTLLGALIFSLSVNEATVYRAARAQDRLELTRVITASAALSVGLALAAILAVAFWQRWLLPSALWLPAAVFLAIIPLNYLAQLCVAFAQTQLGAGQWTLLRITPPIVVAGAATAFLGSGLQLSPIAFLLAYLVANVAVVTLGVTMFNRQRYILALPSWDDLRSLAWFGSRVHTSTVLLSSRDHIDRIIITIMLSSASLGQYVAAGSLASLLLLFGHTADLIMFPAIARALDQDQARQRFCEFTRASLLLIVVGAVTLAAASERLTLTLFGPSFTDAASIAPLMIAAAAVIAFKTVLASGLKARNAPMRIAVIEAVTLAIILFLTPALVSQFGAYGAAAGAVGAQSISLIFLVYAVRHQFSCSLQELLVVQIGDLRKLRAYLARRDDA
ncbi:lipopolysaccharide biosynthesis protein [Terricaulis sp.]|uniref:lipopolysaccharide biosynthesis protein n=1 Tax=Terricaulis sp. TaxID=2768686 RepID=UPI002AC60F3B|nr:oligosaccharide flippase family protein [Terricaulis sp.]MDZ4690009.1 oligosaccharide flippase family protein [Terricaulis sp.]